MAGGGGTRLWPLSRPDRPKPFLPLTGDETLLQATVRRLLDGPELGARPRRSRIAVVTDRRYGPLVREQLGPDVRILAEPVGPQHGRRDRAGDARRSTAATTRSWSCCPPTTGSIRRARTSSAGVLAEAAPASRPARSASTTRWSRSASSRPTRRPSTATCPALRGGPAVGGAAGLPAPGVRGEAAARPRAASCSKSGGRRLERGHVPVAPAARSAPRSRSTRRCRRSCSSRRPSPELALARAYDQIKPLSIDYAVMESAARDHRVVMGALDVGWSRPRRLAVAARGAGPPVRRRRDPARAVRGDDRATTSLVHAGPTAALVVRPMRRPVR